MMTPRVAFVNEIAPGDAPGRIVMPYGDYRYGPDKCDDGRTRDIVQRWTRASAERVADTLPPEGIPVYAGHPDVSELAAKYPDKGALGWITALDVRPEEAVLTVDWVTKPKPGQFKWFSPYWSGPVAYDSDARATLDVDRIVSVGLVNNPRIPDFAFACSAPATDPTTKTQTKGVRMDTTKLAALLGLPEDAGEEQIYDAIAKLKADADTAAAAVDAANTELEAAKQQTEEAKTVAEEAEKECANERAARIELLLANALSDGRITPASMPAWRANLTRSFDRFAKALANERPAVATRSLLRTPGSPGAPKRSLRALANEMARAEGISFDDAWRRLKTASPESFC